MAFPPSKDASTSINDTDKVIELSPPVDRQLYGVVVRPPRFYMQDGNFLCSNLVYLDKKLVLLIDDVVDVVVQGNFVGVVATNLASAQHGAKILQVIWSDLPVKDETKTFDIPPKRERKEIRKANDPTITSREYCWPNRLRWGTQAEWITASKEDGVWLIWAKSKTPGILQENLACMLGCDTKEIEIIGASKHNSVARDCVDDAAADALLLAYLVGKPVTVWLSEEYQQVVTNLGKAQEISATAQWDTNEDIERLDYHLQKVWSSAPVVALLLTGKVISSTSSVFRTSSPYTFKNQQTIEPHTYEGNRYVAEQANTQNTFARESFIDEVANEMQRDPVALRRDYLTDKRGLELLEQVVEKAQWNSKDNHGLAPSKHQDVLSGRGFAYDHSITSEDMEKNNNQSSDAHKLDLKYGTRSAWIVDIEVNRITGEVQLNHLIIGQDTGVKIDQKALQNELQHELLGQNSGLFLSQERFDQWPITTTVASNSKINLIPPPPVVSQTLLETVTRVESSVLNPAVAAIANALYNATGVRFREPPFTPDRIRDQLALADGSILQLKKSSKRWRNIASLAVASSLSLLAIAWPWKGAIPPITRPAVDLYSMATIERGRLIAEAGDCAICHTDLNGKENVGGRQFNTPFGKLYSSNITPDQETGIGTWSFEAFERAMRFGVSRDGSNLYPAFPYTAFAKINKPDMQALYAYLMAQPAIKSVTPEPELNFPFNFRPLMAGWNAMFLDARPFQPDPLRSEQWNRGAYLAEGLGHCSSCHTPRNVFGAEKISSSYFAGAMVDGWEALPLNELSKSPVPWTEEALFSYLRNGTSDQHGVAAGPMAAVVTGLAQLPEKDVKAISHYVASFGKKDSVSDIQVQQLADGIKQSTQANPIRMNQGRRVFESACASCHVETSLPSFTNAQTSLALNTNLYSDQPDNLIQTILYGVQNDTLSLANVNVMPAFNESLADEQIVSLIHFLRAKYAPNNQQWESVLEKVQYYKLNKGNH